MKTCLPRSSFASLSSGTHKLAAYMEDIAGKQVGASAPFCNSPQLGGTYTCVHRGPWFVGGGLEVRCNTTMRSPSFMQCFSALGVSKQSKYTQKSCKVVADASRRSPPSPVRKPAISPSSSIQPFSPTLPSPRQTFYGEYLADQLDTHHRKNSHMVVQSWRWYSSNGLMTTNTVHLFSGMRPD